MKYTLALLLLIGTTAAYADQKPALYPELGPEYDLNIPLVCSYTACVVVVPKSNFDDPVEKERKAYEKRQRRIYCADHKGEC